MSRRLVDLSRWMSHRTTPKRSAVPQVEVSAAAGRIRALETVILMFLVRGLDIDRISVLIMSKRHRDPSAWKRSYMSCEFEMILLQGDFD